MRIALYNYQPRDKEKLENTIKAKRGLIRAINKSSKLSINQKHPQIVISIGGDGTFLGAFHHYQSIVDKVHFMGLDTGHLGFYTDWNYNQLQRCIESLVTHAMHQNVSYALLHTRINYMDNSVQDVLSLNESTIKRTDGSTMIAKLYNNNSNTSFEEFRGDGFCVSTPTGSTAYNKSVGGAVLCPDLNAIELTGIAPINSTEYPSLSSPMVISAGDKFTIVPEDHSNNNITYDSQLVQKPIKSMEFEVSKHRIHFVKYHHIEFWNKVSNAFVRKN